MILTSSMYSCMRSGWHYGSFRGITNIRGTRLTNKCTLTYRKWTEADEINLEYLAGLAVMRTKMPKARSGVWTGGLSLKGLLEVKYLCDPKGFPRAQTNVLLSRECHPIRGETSNEKEQKAMGGWQHLCHHPHTSSNFTRPRPRFTDSSRLS